MAFHSRHVPVAALLLLLAACGNAAGPPGAPPAPLELATTGFGAVPERYSAELAVAPPWAYTTTWSNRGGVPGNALKIWDIGQSNPVLVDSIIVADATTLGDVQISPDGALLVVATEHAPNGSLLIFDRTEPAAPHLLAQHRTANTQAGVHTVKLDVVDGRLYAFLSVNPSPPRLVVLDLSDPAAPVEVLAEPMGSPVIHDVFVRDGWLFTALWHDGIVIWDIGAESGSPAQPRRVGQVRTVGGSAHNAWWYHDPHTGSKRWLFVGEEVTTGALGVSGAGDIHVVDVSDMENPVEVAYYTLANAGSHNFSMDEASGVLYAAYYNGGVRALDVRGDLAACAAAERAADGRCDLGAMGRELAYALVSRPASMRRAVWGVAFTAEAPGPALYATDMFNGLYRLEVGPLVR
jgi:hypothetical protein